MIGTLTAKVNAPFSIGRTANEIKMQTAKIGKSRMKRRKMNVPYVSRLVGEVGALSSKINPILKGNFALVLCERRFSISMDTATIVYGWASPGR